MRVTLPFLLTFVFSIPSFAAGPAIGPDFAERMNRLEAETRALRAELQQLRQEPVRLPRVGATPVSVTAPGVDEDVDYYTWEELQAEIRRNAWTKGDFKIVPYGFLWANMVYETQRTWPGYGSFTGWVYSPDFEKGDAFAIDGRNTRLGLDVAGPRLWNFNCAQSGGKVEIDFQGGFSGTENKAGVLLRHAYWEIKTDDYRILFGQTWDVISPLYPTTTMYTIYWWAGNIGYRRPQLRFERYLHFSPTCLVTLQGSLNHDPLEGSTFLFEVDDANAGWPIIQGRAAVTLGYRGKGYRPGTVGFSGHIGNEGVNDFLTGGDNDEWFSTWSVNVDVDVPVSDRLGFRGEFFYGKNLKTYLGGIGQGDDWLQGTYDVHAHGGWLETYFYWTPFLHSHLGCGVDNPRDADLDAAPTGLTADRRVYNQFYYANLLYDMTEKFRLGVEVSVWKTGHKDWDWWSGQYYYLAPGDSVRTEFMGKYAF